MAQAPEKEYAEAEQIRFALESLELTGDDRLEISGRWFGVRGRRFVRPTLTVLGGDQRSRCLADLEHKPWSAKDGESWTAAFAVELDDAGARELELAVAPDIAVALPLPPSMRDGSGDGHADSDGNGYPLASAQSTFAPRTIAKGHELDVLHQRLDEQRKHVAQLRAELERAGVTRAEMTSALTRRDAAVRKFDAIVRERDEAIGERDEALGERDEALRERDRMTGALDEALTRSELAAHEAAEARREGEGALRERQSMVKALNRLRAERDEAVARRKAALERIAQIEAAANARVAQLGQQLERAARKPAQADPKPAAAGPATPTGAARATGPAGATGPVGEMGPVSENGPVSAAPAPRSPRHRAAHNTTYVWVRRVIALVVLLAAITAIMLIINSP